MPIYEYECIECRDIFSVLQKINADEKNTKCPKCGSSNVKKKLSAFSCYSLGNSSFSSSGFSGFGRG